MQHTNASICMGKPFCDFIFVPIEVVACLFRRKQYRRRKRRCGAVAQLVRECIWGKHPGPLRVASSSHSDGTLWHNFLKQETYTQLLLSTQEYR